MIDKLKLLIEKYNRQYKLLSSEVIEDLNKIIDEETPKPKEVKEIKTPAQEVVQIQEIEDKEETIEELRAKYIDKFQKKPFGWWDKETLKEKLK